MRSARRSSIAACQPERPLAILSGNDVAAPAAGARGAARRHTLRADLARVLARLGRLRRAQARRRASVAGFRLRVRSGSASRGRWRRRLLPTSSRHRCDRRRGVWLVTPTSRSSDLDGRRARHARDRSGRRREDPLHVGLDRRAERRHQHAPDALQQPADDPADAAVSRRRAAGARRLAALAPHVRRQPQHRHRRLQRRLAVPRRRPSDAGRVRRERAQPPRSARRRSISTCRRATKSWCGRLATRPAARGARSSRRVQVLFYAAASLSQHVADELSASPSRRAANASCSSPASARPRRRRWRSAGRGRASCRRRSACPCRASRPSSSPVAQKLEMRVRGPNVTPGLLAAGRADPRRLRRRGLLLHGRCGAARSIDEDLSKGLVFDGRIKEDFKLSTGTWVSVGPLRAQSRGPLRALRARRGDCRTRPRRGRPAARAGRRRLPPADARSHGGSGAPNAVVCHPAVRERVRDAAGDLCGRRHRQRFAAAARDSFSRRRPRSMPAKSPTKVRSISAPSSSGGGRSSMTCMPAIRRRTSLRAHVDGCGILTEGERVAL